MMKNFTKILLGLSASATCLTANAMEWRVVSKEDFGGNKDGDPAICTAAPHDNDADAEGGFYTPLKFKGDLSGTPGEYMVLKSTAAKNSWNEALLLSYLNWANFGDHTYPDNPDKGYFMIFDSDRDLANQYNDLVLYRKALPVDCSGVLFKFTAYMASASKEDAGNLVTLSIKDGITDGSKDVGTPLHTDLHPSTVTPGEWTKMETQFTLNRDDINKVYFEIIANSVEPVGYDFALDDIEIAVNQPTINIKAGTFFYKEPATLTTTYNQSEFDSFFGTDYSNVVYQWYKYDEGKKAFVELGGPSTYSSSKDISYTIPSFVKANDNGTYKVVVATKGNIGNSLCSIQKEFVVNQERDEMNVDICQDSTRTILGTTISRNSADVDVEDILSSDNSMLFHVKNVKYETLEPLYVHQCLNNDYKTAGDFPLDDIVTLYPVTELWPYGCPKTVQKQIMRVESGNVKDKDKHICVGKQYISDDNVPMIYTEVDEKVGTKIEFDEDGCRHEQYVFVHPKKESTVDVFLCEGESYGGVPYNTATKSPIKGSVVRDTTIWGCDSLITPMITVYAPVVVEKSVVVCPSDNYEFNGEYFIKPVEDTLLKSVIKGGAANGCDSTTILHLTVKEGGTIYMDTLICKDQILWGDSFTVAGPTQLIREGFTESGCKIDTVWNIEVVEISLRLRLYNNQDEVCQGQESTLDAKLKAYDTRNRKTLTPTYHWEPEVPSNSLNPTVILEETTTYTIFADLDLPSDVDKNAKGCHAKEVKTIKVNPIPELSIDSVNPEDRSVEYTVTGGTMPYHMYLGGSKDKNQGTKDLGLLETNFGRQERLPYGKHLLQVHDSTGCSAEEEIEVKATEPEPPTYFTPNNDGENDFWRIKNIDVYPDCNIRIYDRFGKLILSTTGKDFDQGWDGTYNDKKMPATDYWYEINIDDIDKQYFGHFTLMR